MKVRIFIFLRFQVFRFLHFQIFRFLTFQLSAYLMDTCLIEELRRYQTRQRKAEQHVSALIGLGQSFNQKIRGRKRAFVFTRSALDSDNYEKQPEQ